MLTWMNEGLTNERKNKYRIKTLMDERTELYMYGWTIRRENRKKNEIFMYICMYECDGWMDERLLD